MNRLDAGARAEVTLIRGGPGWGKTSLAAEWARTGRAPGPIAWLALDRHDNNPAGLWSYVLAALRGTGAFPNGGPLDGLVAGTVDRNFLRRIAGAIAALRHPVVVVLDDLHEITDPRVLASLTFLLRHPVSNLRLLVTTRVGRTAPLHRPRLREGLFEVGAAELNFDPDEAVDLFARRGLRLTPTEAGLLLDRTEGWAAGLVLAADLMTDRGVPAGLTAFTGSERSVADYLSAEVLGTTPADLRQFLASTCVVERVCGDLADALTGGTHGERNLERLAGSSSLVTSLGSGSRWFRYHWLLTDMLRHRLTVEGPEAARQLHSRAARWFARQEAGLSATAHAVAAQDWALVGRLVVTAAGARIVSTDRKSLIELLSRVPPEQFSATGGLELCYALLAYDRQDYPAATAGVARARRLLAHEDENQRQAGEVMARSFDTALARERGDMAALVDAAEDTLLQLARIPPAQLSTAREYQAIALNNAGVGWFWTGRPGRAETRLRAGMAVARSVDAELTQINALSHLALLEAVRGDLHDAYEHAGAALEVAGRRGWQQTLQAVPAYVALALTNLEWHRLSAADEALEAGLAAQRADPEPIQRPALRLTQVRVLLAHGEADMARLVAERVVDELGTTGLPPVLAQWLAVAEVELELSSGRPAEVLSRVGDLPAHLRADARVRTGVARAHLALGALPDAEAVLAPLRHSASDLASAVEIWLATALLDDAMRQNGRSNDAFARAVALAEPQNLRRPFLGVEHARVAPLLERYQWLAPQESPFVAALLAGATSERAMPVPEPGLVVEELTDRERDVLRYLPTMLRNQDIAEQMYVSVNTVKAHLRSLYRKLDVTQRREAVDRARELGLL